MMFARLPRPPRGRVCGVARGVVHAGALAAAIAMAACSSPSSRFYTLGGADASAGATANAAPAAAHTASVPAWLIEVAPVNVPPQVSRNQLVVQTGPTQVQLLEQERWASLPGDEIRRARDADFCQAEASVGAWVDGVRDTRRTPPC